MRHLPPAGGSLSQRGSPWQKRKVSAQRLRLPLRQQGVKCGTGNLADCQGLSLWERWHREAMTERASPLTAAQSLGLDRASDGAALPQGSAKPSAQLLVSILALSGASRQLSQRESFFEKANFPVHPKPLTLGEVASRSDDGEGKPGRGETPRKFRLGLSVGRGQTRHKVFVQTPQSPPLPFVQDASEL